MKKLLKIIFIFVLLFMCSKVFAFDEYKRGETVIFNGESYHVIEDSDSESNYITLLKDYPLSVDELYIYGRNSKNELFVNEYLTNIEDPEKVIYEFDGNYGGMAYYTSKHCTNSLYWNISSFSSREGMIDGCLNNYNSSDVKKVVDNWSSRFKNDLVGVDGYKARILTYDDLINNLGFELAEGASNYIISNKEFAEWFL